MAAKVRQTVSLHNLMFQGVPAEECQIKRSLKTLPLYFLVPSNGVYTLSIFSVMLSRQTEVLHTRMILECVWLKLKSLHLQMEKSNMKKLLLS